MQIATILRCVCVCVCLREHVFVCKTVAKLHEMVQAEERQRVEQDLVRVVEIPEAVEMVQRWWATEQPSARFRCLGTERSPSCPRLVSLLPAPCIFSTFPRTMRISIG